MEVQIFWKKKSQLSSIHKKCRRSMVVASYSAIMVFATASRFISAALPVPRKYM